MIICQYKETPIAFAPEAINNLINKYTDHVSYLIVKPTASLRPHTDILHLHNLNRFNFPNKVIQYHSEPFRVNLNVTCQKLVIAQYHATLPEYQNCKIVRNPIDIFDSVFMPKYYDKKIRIGYAPSNTNVISAWADKGYNETIPILQKIKSEYKNKVDIDIITDTPLNVCLVRKSLCNIFIDEVKTGSYHRSGLEGLAMGEVTICSVSPEVERVMVTAANAPNQPFVNIYYQDLYSKLTELIESGLNNILEEGWKSRHWMEQYWHPEIIANEYIKIYENIK
jgi:hypothetical protein